MDGNGRWAKAHMLPRMAGHRAGTENLRQIIKACIEFGVKHLTIYAFSTENWKRQQDEVDGLMDIFADVLEKELPELHAQGVQVRHLGREQELSPILREKLQNAIDATRDNQNLVLSIALNYGGRDEIITAIKNILKEEIPVEKIDEKIVADHLYTAGLPDPDLVIRTSGEMRTSNFLVWQSTYSEWYFTTILWPDFDKEKLREAIIDYGNRSRRFGGRTKKEKEEAYNG